MPAKPWKAFGTVNPDREYVALLSYLPLKSYSRLPAFVRYTQQVIGQLASAKGLVGYSLLAHPLSKKAWTLSAWESSGALLMFVQDPPHVRIMTALAPHLLQPAFLRWTAKGSRLPLRWDEALARFASDQSVESR
jgi:hypothetical protein